MPDYDSSIGAEVGGPIIKDRLFFWAGFAPRFENTPRVPADVRAAIDPATMSAKLDAAGNPIQVENTFWRARIPESRQTYSYAATLDFIPRPEHHLTVAAMGTPNFNTQMRVVQRDRVHLEPALGAGAADKSNNDFTAHWTSKLLRSPLAHRRAPPACTPSTSTTARPTARSTTGTSSSTGAPTCRPREAARLRADRHGFQPCPVDHYHTGGFGLTKQYTGDR